jgi:DNA-binding transcriptional regulator YdaS (Cro superfamily)
MNGIDALQKVIKKFGTQKKFADAIGCTQAHVSIWINRDKKVPQSKINEIIFASNNTVDKYDLRPDIYGKRPTSTDLFKEAFRVLFHSFNTKKFIKISSILIAIIGLGFGGYFASKYIPENSSNDRVKIDLPITCKTCLIKDACLVQ